MPVLSSAEEKKQQETKEKRRQTLLTFVHDIKTSFSVWIKLGGFIFGFLSVAYLFAKFVLKWDLFYETDVKYPTILFWLGLAFVGFMIACWVVAFIYYNKPHKRNTKYNNYVDGYRESNDKHKTIS